MACVWYYKGHKFDTEIQLDDFLLERKKYESSLGDSVFSLTNSQIPVIHVLNDVHKKSTELKKIYEDMINTGKIYFDEDGEMYGENPPYIGVNKYLASKYKKEDDTRLFPEFVEENYWNKRFEDWKQGMFTDDEIQEFGIDKNNPPKIIDNTQAKKYQEQMKNRWKQQANVGTAVHECLQIFFKSRPDMQWQRNFEIMNDQQMYDYITQKISKRNLSLLNEKTIKQAIQHGRTVLSELKVRYGDNLVLFPEFAISANTSIEIDGKTDKLFGIIDLLVIDSKGKTHIIDWKTSVHPYVDFNAAKKGAYRYQLATYQRMIEMNGIKAYSGDMLISPIMINNFRKEGNRYIYDGIQTYQTFEEIGTVEQINHCIENIDMFLSNPFTIEANGDEIGKNIKEKMSKFFPNYKSKVEYERNEVIEELKQLGKFTPNEQGYYIYKMHGRDPIITKSEKELVDEVIKVKQRQAANILYVRERIKQCINDTINGKPANWEQFGTYKKTDAEYDWLESTLKPYCNGYWEVMDNMDKLLSNYGIIMLKTKNIPGLQQRIDIVRVSSSPLSFHYNTKINDTTFQKRRKYLTYAFQDDVVEKSKPNSLMLEATYGNVELMETLTILNSITGLENYSIGNIAVVNPYTSSGNIVSNEELKYSYETLCRLGGFDVTQLRLFNQIKFANRIEQVMFTLRQLLNDANIKNRDKLQQIIDNNETCKSMYDLRINGIDQQDRYNALKKIYDVLTNKNFFSKSDEISSQQKDLMEQTKYLTNIIAIAMAEIKGYNFRQQVIDHDKYFEAVNPIFEGVSGSYLDNPGNLNSETLNMVTKIVTEGYQNTRDAIIKQNNEFREIVRKLKKEKGFNAIKENTIGNQAELYKNLVYVNSDGDLLFKRPEELYGAEKEFLEYILTRINKYRYKGKSQQEIETARREGHVQYYRVPLQKGDMQSNFANKTWQEILKAKFKHLNPKYVWNKTKQVINNFANSDQNGQEFKERSLMFWNMTNMFDEGLNSEKRMRLIKEKGIDYFEKNLETLFLKHQFAYIMQENMNAVFPVIRAAAAHLTMQGGIVNKQFKNDLEYLQRYVKEKILNQTVTDPKLDYAYKATSEIRKIASIATLAFAPVQMLYQPIQGLWNDIKVMITKPDGKQSFTFSNMKKALGIVYADLFHYSDTPSKVEALNQLCGINDMDMNMYIDRISSAKKGVWNFWNFAMKFSSRPDYYNRMTLFISQMIGDGVWDAVSVDKNGNIKYDWKKDKRFEAFANGWVNDNRYNQQKALYYTIAKQFVTEHTKNPDGTDFVIDMSNPKPLPRFYTNKEIESMKSLSDDIYGYYSHEKKSLVHSTLLGSMWLQFRTFWSGKKNQYLQSGGVRLRGDWKQVEENGQKYYYQVDEKGNVLFNEPPTTKNTGVPFMQWTGRWQEGLILTLADTAKAMANGFSQNGWKGTKQEIMNKWNESDKNLRSVYRQNIKQFMYDMIMMLIAGLVICPWLMNLLDDEMKGKEKNKDAAEGARLALARVFTYALRNSFLDFDIGQSLMSPAFQWSPFALEFVGRDFNNIWNIAMGETDAWDGVINCFGAAKQVKPFFDSIKPDEFRTEREGGTWKRRD